MERGFSNKWGNKNITVKVRNKACGRIDVHRRIAQDEITWLTANPNLEVEVMEYSMNRRKDRKKNG